MEICREQALPVEYKDDVSNSDNKEEEEDIQLTNFGFETRMSQMWHAQVLFLYMHLRLYLPGKDTSWAVKQGRYFSERVVQFDGKGILAYL